MLHKCIHYTQDFVIRENLLQMLWPSVNCRKMILLIKGKSHDLLCCNWLLTQERPEWLTSISIETINWSWINLPHWIHMQACFYYSWPIGTLLRFVGFVLKGCLKRRCYCDFIGEINSFGCLNKEIGNLFSLFFCISQALFA